MKQRDFDKDNLGQARNFNNNQYKIRLSTNAILTFTQKNCKPYK